MHEIAQAFSSPVWWLTSGIMAFAMSLLAYYAGPQLDRLLAYASDKARRRNERRLASHRADLASLLANDSRQTRLWLFTIYGDLLAIRAGFLTFLGIALLYLFAQQPRFADAGPTFTNALLAIGTLNFLLLFWSHTKSFKNFELLREAWREEGGRVAAGTEPPRP